MENAFCFAEELSPSSSGLLLAETKELADPQRSLFDYLTPEDAVRLSEHLRPKTVRADQYVFQQGETHTGIYVILSGRVRVFYIAPTGREITLAYWNEGNFIGGPDVFSTSTHIWSGRAAEDSEVGFIPGKQLKKLVTSAPSLAIGLIENLSYKGQCYSVLAQMLGTRSITERLAYLLLRLCEIKGQSTASGRLITAEYSHSEMANVVGATRQWVAMTLKKFSAQGAIDLKGGNIYVRDMRMLASLCDRD